MSSARRPVHATLVLLAAAFIASGCGGGDEAAAGDVGTGVTPTPETGVGTETVAGTPGATDPATGQPIVDPAAGGATSATVPELVGDDVAGGLDPVSSAPTLLDAQAIEVDKLEDIETSDKPTTTTTESTATTDTTPAVTYTGAKIYVDGIVHSVNRNGTFPKGDPVFKLLSITGTDIEISLVAGEFTSSGGEGTFLDLGDMVSLVNASEQVTYRVKYLRPITSTSDISF